jgi:hypothetical protein
MGTISKPNTFSPNATISSSAVNDNFDTAYNAINGNLDANNLATGAVTTAKIADSNVTTVKLADANVTTAKLADASVTASKLSSGAITLVTPITSSTGQTGISTSPVLVTNLSTTVTVPTGGRSVRIEAQVAYITSTLACTWYLYIYNSATVTGSPIQTVAQLQAINGAIGGASIWFEHTPTAGSQSYCIAISCDNGTGNTSGLTSTKLATMSVKLV